MWLTRRSTERQLLEAELVPSHQLTDDEDEPHRVDQYSCGESAG